MNVTWDPRKARSNLAKHGVRFSDAEIVLFDPSAITSEDASSQSEQRFVSIGTDSIGRILVLVFSHRREEFRLISARKATRKERKQYEEGI